MRARSSIATPLIGSMLCCGIRGATPGDPALEADLDACASAHVRSVILFDVHVPRWIDLQDAGIKSDVARNQATRNIVSPDQLSELISHIRKRLGDDTLIAIDQEGGHTSRLNARHGFQSDPSAAEFARLSHDSQIIAANSQASQLASVGIDINFAPCVDVAVNPDCPIIAGVDRSFGPDPSKVTACARTIIDAHRRHGVLTCLKHFPGHGSATGDTHLGIVDISATWDRESELAPFRDLVRSGHADAVMAAHVICGKVDRDQPASLSRATLTDLLRTDLQFNGPIVTDSLDMRAIVDRCGEGEALVRAINAGADMLVHGFNLNVKATDHPAPAMVDGLLKALSEGRIAGGVERLKSAGERIATLRTHTSRRQTGR